MNGEPINTELSAIQMQMNQTANEVSWSQLKMHRIFFNIPEKREREKVVCFWIRNQMKTSRLVLFNRENHYEFFYSGEFVLLSSIHLSNDSIFD